IALLTREAQAVRDAIARDELSMLVVALHDPARSDATAATIRERFPDVEAYSMHDILETVQGLWAYFNAFSMMLRSVSIAVCVLLVTTLVTLSIGERLGELAILQAIGLRRGRLMTLVIVESVSMVFASLPVTFGVGRVIAWWLD